VGSEKPIGADNQQGSRSAALSVAGLTPQRLHAELLAADVRESRAYLQGALRDGTFNRTHQTVRISQADRQWLDGLRLLFAKLGSRSWIYQEGQRNVWVIESTCRLEKEPIVSSDRERAAFARGYFDAEGGIPRDGRARFYIQFVQKDRPDLEGVRRCLERLGLECGRIQQSEHSDRSGVLEVLCPQAIARGLHSSRSVLASEETSAVRGETRNRMKI
jgi:hypothetical protein